MSLRERKHRWVRRARILMGVELTLSVIFDLTMIGGAVRKGQMLNCLLIVVITINIMTAARLLLKLRGTKCASSIVAYVLWKIVQEVIMIPALVVFTFILVDRYLKSWENANRGVQILVVVWTYAAYSLFLIVALAYLARFLWQLQSTQHSTDKNENLTTISFIDGFQTDTDHHQLINTEMMSSRAVSNEGLELREMPPRDTRPFIPYDHIVPYSAAT